MNQVINQISQNIAALTVFMVAAAALITSTAWGILAIVRMLQITIATNITLSRELTAIQQAIGKIPGGTSPTGMFASSSKVPGNEGEFVAYDEEELYRQEIDQKKARAAKEFNDGLSDEELNRHIKNAVGTAVD